MAADGCLLSGEPGLITFPFTIGLAVLLCLLGETQWRGLGVRQHLLIGSNASQIEVMGGMGATRSSENGHLHIPARPLRLPETVDINHSLGKGLRGFLRQIVTDATG